MKHVAPAGLSISRVSGDDEHIEIRLTDFSSHIEFATMKLSLEEFAKAITGQGWIRGQLELIGLSFLGQTEENKEEFIECDGLNKQARDKAVKKAEVDGWTARQGDIDNHHRYNNNGVRVVFFRRVGKSFVQREQE